ncbi:glucoside xylosyltransferase 1-like [Eriocheir sinensis]|uniref:glucoside xylosyltransferase 1-like n=1 Tax=Eriocheir sinensis TaxID=95602 RepID=UPI0021C6C856|nr:glucoside xylosyltransferase 1-like [Eriocheir sinensis]
MLNRKSYKITLQFSFQRLSMRSWTRILVPLVIIVSYYTFRSIVPKHIHKSVQKNATYRIPKPLTTANPSLTYPMTIVVCEAVDAMGSRTSSKVIVKDDSARSWSRQTQQLNTMLKTLLYFSKSPVWHIIVLTDTLDTFHKVLNLTAAFPRHRLLLQHRPVWLPQDQPLIKEHWRPCAWAKQFLAEALPEHDAVVYVDTDVVFLGPAEELWWLLRSMGPRQALALAPEPQYLLDSPRHPFAGRVGLNTGVMAANLTRLRRLPGGGLGSAVLRFGAVTPPPRHDQDAVNHYLFHRPHLLLEVTSRWNFLPSSCFPEAPPCADCLSAGILILHGSDATFFRNIDRKFLLVYKTLASLHLSGDPRRLLAVLEGRLAVLDSWSHDYLCSNYTDINRGITLGLTNTAVAKQVSF